MNKEYLRQLLYDYYNKNNKIPSKEDINLNNFGVSLHTYLKEFKTNSWREVLIQCGFNVKLKKKVEYTKEILLDNLKEYYNLLGRIPTFDDFKLHKFKPNFNLYSKNFGSYNNACFLAGLIDECVDNENTKKERTLDEIKTLSYQLQRIPTVEEYENYKKHGYCHSKFHMRFGKSFVQICKEILPEYSLSKRITLEEIEFLVKDYYRKYNKVPFLRDLNLSSNIFKDRDFPINYKQFLRQLSLPMPLSYSDNELLDMFYGLYNKLNRIPSANEIIEESCIPHWSTYQNRFGSLKNICDLLNIEYNSFYGVGNYCVDKNNNPCKSLSEAFISNYYIDKNIEFEKEVSYSELVKGDRRLFDWKIKYKNKIYYVEYFGLYFPDKKGKIIKHYIKSTKRKIRDLYKNNHHNNCIFIFPGDLNRLDEIFNKVS